MSQLQHDTIEQLQHIIKEQRSEIFRLKNIIDNLPGSIYWKDMHGLYLGRNTYSYEKSKSVHLEGGDSLQDSVIGKSDYDLFPKDIADGYRKNDLEVMETGQEIVCEESTTLPNGETIVQLSRKRPLYNEQGKIIGIVGNTVDITHLKKIEKKLMKAKEKLERANVLKTEFIRNMEHDIRTPFNGIWAIAKHLWEAETDAEKKELLGDVTNSAKELMEYFNGILDFSKIEQRNVPLLERKFNIRQLVDSIILMETPPAKHKKLQLTLVYDEQLPPVLIGDRDRLQRILINLVSNAIKFTHQGYVKLHVTLAKQLDGRHVILCFTIEDTGIGIPQEKQDIIFEKFAKVAPSNKGAYKWVGLGLCIVKQFIEEMGGEIDLNSALGKGSSFVCTFPFKLPLINDMAEDRLNLCY